MSNVKESIQNKQNLNIIEETIGNTKVPFSEVFKLYVERILEGEENNLFQDNDLINLDISEKNKFKIQGILPDLFYDGEFVYSPIIVSFEKDDKNKMYKIFTKKYFDKIYKEMNFMNPVILIRNSYEKYEPKKFSLLTRFNSGAKIFKILEKKEENFREFYSKKLELKKECTPSVLTPNFKYYFSSPKTDCRMKFSLSNERRQAIFSIFTFTDDKINSIYGPYGSGKTTSLILKARSSDNICYLNLNALYQNKNDLFLWKFDLFLKELYNLFKKEKEENKEEEKEDTFNNIKEKILKCNHFWEAISLSIEFCINNKIESIFILDQYKEEIDPKFSEFKKIKNSINKTENTFVKLVVASSTNNSDIREFIIQKYIEKLSKEKFINDYYYIKSMFKITDIAELINILSQKKKNIFEEYFSNIPIYFYSIYDSKEEDINQTVENIKKTIIDDIEHFFKNNVLSHEDLSFIIQNYPKIGVNYSKEKEEISEIIEKDVINKFIRILPIKYFIFEIQDESIVKISFYFKLAKICFLEFIFKRIYELFEQPKLQIPERTIGDLLELIVIENFKNNSKEKIDQVSKVDSIWEMGSVEGLDKNNVKNNNILIIQKNEKAKYVDFGFLLEGKTLVLVQCKKALSKEPNDYISIHKTFNHRNYLYDSFKKNFDCEIKQIKLFYLTDIYFTNREKNLYHSWSKKDKTFEVLEKITKENNIPLVFFDVQKKNLLIRNYDDQKTFDSCTITSSDSLICNGERYDYVKIESNEEELTKIFKGIKSQFEIKEAEFFKKSKIEQKSDNKISIDLYEAHLNRKINKDKRVVINEPDTLFLSNNDENLLTTFKIGEKQCFSYYDSVNKKMKYVKIENGKTKDFEFKDMKIYYLQKKIKREKFDK